MSAQLRPVLDTLPGPWSPQDLPWPQLDAAAVRDDEDLFLLVVCASFIESGSELYTRNLIAFYAGDTEIETWLREHWEPEELQHGRALRAYVERLWPEFDWPGAFRSFFADYARACSPDELEPTRTRELVARCVVEAGTTAYYRALAAAAPEPVLRELARRIAHDELRHYKHFLRYFRRIRQREGAGRGAVLSALLRRLLELRDDDAECAIRHAWAYLHPQRAQDRRAMHQAGRRMNRVLRRHLPVDLAIHMLLKPLHLSGSTHRLVARPLSLLVNRVLLRA